MSAHHIKKTFARTTLMVAVAAGLAGSMQGCVLVVAGAAASGALVATDRRTVGTQTEDREIQLKALPQVAQQLPEDAHVSVAVFNRRVLLTGEVPSEQYKQQAESIVRGIKNVDAIINELSVMPKSTVADRATDAYLESRVKAQLIAEQDISANDFKVVCTRGVVYLLGLVTPEEGTAGANAAASVIDVAQVVKLFQYVQPQAAQPSAPISSAAATSASDAAPDAEPTLGAVPIESVSEKPLALPDAAPQPRPVKSAK